MRNEAELMGMSKNMRLKALEMAFMAGKNGAHLGGGLSAIEILAVLYGTVAKLDVKKPNWEERDRILISKAHCVLALYTALYEVGFLTEEDLDHFEANGSEFVGHPQKNLQHGIEYAGGSLGMALSVGAGMAYDLYRKNKGQRVYVLLGDGECEEGSVWEAFLFAAKNHLSNLTVIIDKNHLQYDGSIEEVGGMSNIQDKLNAFGWEVIEVNGHDVSALLSAFEQETQGKPKAIIADTIKGKGVSFMEGNYLWHHSQLSKEQYEQAVEEIMKETKRAGD